MIYPEVKFTTKERLQNENFINRRRWPNKTTKTNDANEKTYEKTYEKLLPK